MMQLRGPSESRRRTSYRYAALLALVLGSLPATAHAQQAAKTPMILYLLPGTVECKMQPPSEAFLQGFRDLGYVHGQSVIVDRRCYGTAAQARKLLDEFIVDRRADVIATGGPAAALLAKNATREIPIVCMSCGDPVDNGLVASLARPGGNVTGLASLSAELIGKRVEQLKEALPGVSRVAALLNPDNPGTRPTVKALEAIGRPHGLEIERVEFRNAGDFEKAFRSAVAKGAGAVLIQDDPHTFAGRIQIAELALKHRLAAVAGQLENAEAGALMAYGPDRVDIYRRAAAFVDKILKGTKPADLPIEQPTKFDLVINMKTAKKLGLAIPPSLLLRADRVIE
jgi:putative ABC transport system substrate-binding protein